MPNWKSGNKPWIVKVVAPFGGTVANLTRLALTGIVAILFGLSFEVFAQAPPAGDDSATKRTGPPQCATELERLSSTIEDYLRDREAQRQISPIDFARGLRSAFPIAGCDTDAVRGVLSKNPFFRVALDHVYPDRSVMEIRLGDAQILITVLWSIDERAPIRDGIRGKRKRIPPDFQY